MAIDKDTALAESRGLAGPLGAVAYVVLKGLASSGAEATVISGVRTLMQEHFSRLSDPDCNALCDVLAARLEESRRAGGPWYGGNKKT